MSLNLSIDLLCFVLACHHNSCYSYANKTEFYHKNARFIFNESFWTECKYSTENMATVDFVL